MDQLITEEEPDPGSRLYDPLDRDEQERSDKAERDVEFPQREEVGRVRPGRLVAPDEGFGADVDAELYVSDVGIDGSAASAEEAAMHTMDDDG